MNQISSTRQLHYDLLRIFASFMVVMLHVSAFYWDKIQPQTEQWMALNLFDSAVRSCVPLFFMLSGAFLLAKELPLNKLLGKNVLHLAVVWLVWSVLYAVDAIGLPAFFHADAGQIFTAVVNGKYHLWFLPKMIEVYLMVPLLYAGTRMKEGKGLYYLLVLFGLFGILKSTLTVFVYPNPSIQVLLKTKLPQFSFLFRVFSAGIFSGASLEEKNSKPVAAADTAGQHRCFYPARTDGCHSERTARRYFLWVFLPSGLSGGNMPVFTV